MGYSQLFSSDSSAALPFLSVSKSANSFAAWLTILYFQRVKLLQLLLEGLRIALHSLRAHRLRSLLTMLGVAIGIFAITIIFTLVNSLDHSIGQSISRLGNTMLFVYHVPWSNDALNWQKYYQRPKVSFNEYLALKHSLPYADGVAYEVRVRNQKLRYGSASLQQIGVRAITEDYLWMNALDFKEGRPMTELEANAGRAVCVLGYNIAEKLFVGEQPVGKWVYLRGKKVRVVGVLEKSGANAFGSNPDELVYIPYVFAARIYSMQSPRLDKYISVKVSRPERMQAVEDEIIGRMRTERGLRPGKENDFEVNKPEMLISMFSNATRYLRIGGVVISLFSILVGGFGIGNIMYTTVKERTFEIGVQKALGATRSFILFQFLSESVIICILGGLIGLALNYGITQLIQFVLIQMETNFSVVVSMRDMALGVAMSAVIGLVSGLIPSMLAARMDPVESMRA